MRSLVRNGDFSGGSLNAACGSTWRSETRSSRNSNSTRGRDESAASRRRVGGESAASPGPSLLTPRRGAPVVGGRTSSRGRRAGVCVRSVGWKRARQVNSRDRQAARQTGTKADRQAGGRTDRPADGQAGRRAAGGRPAGGRGLPRGLPRLHVRRSRRRGAGLQAAVRGRRPAGGRYVAAPRRRRKAGAPPPPPSQ